MDSPYFLHLFEQYYRPSRPVTLNLGMQMPAWFDVFGLTPDAEEDEDGINESVKIVHSMIDEVKI